MKKCRKKYLRKEDGEQKLKQDMEIKGDPVSRLKLYPQTELFA